MHPLAPLTPSDVNAASAIIKHHETGRAIHFKNIELLEPPKKQLRPYLRQERQAAIRSPSQLPRRVSILYYHRGTAALFRAIVNLDEKRVDDIQALDPRYHGQADTDEVLEVREKCLSHPRVVQRIKRYELPEDFTVVCDTWPYGRDSSEMLSRLTQVWDLRP
jgi:primary-amine oxidase